MTPQPEEVRAQATSDGLGTRGRPAKTDSEQLHSLRSQVKSGHVWRIKHSSCRRRKKCLSRHARLARLRPRRECQHGPAYVPPRAAAPPEWTGAPRACPRVRPRGPAERTQRTTLPAPRVTAITRWRAAACRRRRATWRRNRHRAPLGQAAPGPRAGLSSSRSPTDRLSRAWRAT